MDNPWKVLSKLLKSDLEREGAHGRKADFLRQTGFARSTVDRWLDGKHAPGIDDLPKIAEWFGVQPWELIKPEFEKPTVIEMTPLASLEKAYILLKNYWDIIEKLPRLNEADLASIRLIARTGSREEGQQSPAKAANK
jgi:transcriptional regulator with XRE-family HTH domain